jgi:DNA-binding SARP family transcriptional activator
LVEFRILGPLEAHHRGRTLRLGGLKQRALLAMLLLRRNEAVSTDRLIDALWDTSPPPTARQALQNHVAALRRALGPGVLVTRHPGYLLRVEPEQLDLDRFRRLLAEARAALDDGNAAAAAGLLRVALKLWRGPPLADLAAAGLAWARCAELGEERLAAVETRVEADLALGRHRELIGELEALVRAEPLRERLCGQLLLALYRSGRQAEALAAYRVTRDTFVDELGIEPGAELRALERAILAHDPSLRPPGSARGAPAREERRLVTVLFAAVDDGTQSPDGRDPEDVRRVLTRRLGLVRDEVERVGGSVQHVVGATAVALFGAPRAHGDDPERAVRAALAIRDAATGPSGPARVAVATGEALLVPGEGPGPPAVAGEVVTVGAGLLEATPLGRVLVTAITARATQRAVAYRPVRLSSPAGRSPPVALEALHVRARPWPGPDGGERVPLVGRAAELGLLAARFDRARDERTPQLVTLVGDPGIGKSRLVAEFRTLLDRRGDSALWRQGRSLPYGKAMTFWALAEIVKLHAGILETDGAAVAERKLAQAVRAAVPGDREGAWVARHLRPLVGGDGERPAADSRPEDPLAAWRRFLAGLAARQPLVLVFEDVHWADEALLDLVDSLVERTGPVPLLVIAMARPELLERRPGWGAGRPAATTLPLTPLPQAEAATLVDGLLARRHLPPGSAATLVARVGGNPLFAEEYVRMLADRRAALAGDGPAEGGRGPAGPDPVPLPLPETVHGIIAARLDRLPPEERAVLEDAAVFGRVGWAGAVAAVGGHDRQRLAASLRRLERRELLRRLPRSRVAGQTEYSFGHVLVRDVAYARIPRAQRAEKHRRAAAWIEALAADRTEERAELLAHHYQQALAAARGAGQATRELTTRARAALRAAGDRAASLSAYGAAARSYTAALALSPADDPERPELLFRLGSAHFLQDGDGERLLAQARDALLAAGARSRAAEAEVLLGLLAWRRGRDDRTAMARALTLVRDGPPSRSKAFVLSRGALRFAIEGRVEEAVATGREALAMAERLGLREQAAKAASAIGIARTSRGDAGGLADLERAAAMLERDNSPAAANVLINLAAMRAKLGDLQGCFAAQAAAQLVAERFGSAAELRWLEGERVVERYWTGRWDEALDLADAFVAASQGGDAHYLEPSCRFVRGRIRLARGDLPGALEDSASALAVARRTHDDQILDPALAFRGRVLLEDGRGAEAAALTSELLAGLPGHVLYPEVGVDLAVLLVATGRPAATLDAAGIPSSPWLEATRAFVAGDHHAAATLYTRIGSTPEAIFVHGAARSRPRTEASA